MVQINASNGALSRLLRGVFAFRHAPPCEQRIVSLGDRQAKITPLPLVALRRVDRCMRLRHFLRVPYVRLVTAWYVRSESRYYPKTSSGEPFWVYLRRSLRGVGQKPARLGPMRRGTKPERGAGQQVLRGGGDRRSKLKAPRRRPPFGAAPRFHVRRLSSRWPDRRSACCSRTVRNLLPALLP